MSSQPRVEDYSFGHIRIDGQDYTADVIILPDRVIADWWREEGHSLSMDDLGAVVAAGPAVLVVGTGANGLMRVPDQTLQALKDTGIEVIVERTGSAWQTYNRHSQQRATAAALHLTC